LHVLGFLLFGLLIGGVTSTLVARTSPAGRGVSMLCGVAGAMVGGFFGRIAGLYGDGEPAAFVMSLLGSFALVVVYHAATARRRHA
jgi:uncharacterized membrane protein YeaQ/YmgE (transglycosylase-associated protein family)